MKYLLLLAIVLIVLWLARTKGSPAPKSSSERATPQPAAHEEMVACAQCGMHLPRSEALPGRGGFFCGEPHRTVFEKSHAPP